MAQFRSVLYLSGAKEGAPVVAFTATEISTLLVSLDLNVEILKEGSNHVAARKYQRLIEKIERAREGAER